MRSHSILLMTLLLFATGIIGCGLIKSDADRVQEVIDSIAEYKANYEKNCQEIEPSIANMPKVTKEMSLYSDNLGQLNVSSCPEDFRKCYEDYAKSIANIVNLCNQVCNNDNAMAALMFMAQIAASADEVKKSEETLYQLAKEKYGATVPEAGFQIK